VGAAAADFGLLADAVSTAQSFVDVFVSVYVLLIFVYVLSSWVRLPYSVTLNRIQRFLYDVCEPYLRLFRRVLPSLGPIDVSPIVAVIVLVALDQIVVRLLDRLH
jgi:YggT family protein